VIFRKILALALIVIICVEVMPYAFINGVATGTIGLLAGALAFAKINNITVSLAAALSLFAAAALCKMFEIGIPGILISICFAFSGGVMLYIVCGELLPDKN